MTAFKFLILTEIKDIAYVGPFSFPNGGAAARRILGNVATIQDCGYKVIIGSGQMARSLNVTRVFNYKGIEVHSLDERVAENLKSPLKNFVYLRMGRKTIEWLDKLPQKPAVIILYSGYAPYFIRLLPWCKRHGVPLIFDAVEWYQASNKFKGMFSPYYWNIALSMRKLSLKAKNIISISTYLHDYYKMNNCASIIIPPTLNTEEYIPNLGTIYSGKLSIAYTGTPGHKDLFNNYLEAVLRMNASGVHIIFKVAGVSVDKILKYDAFRSRKITCLPLFIETMGVVSHSDAIDLVKKSDFSVLLRKINKVSKAGFPTKVVESMAVGTPVICNLTSDLYMYIRDGIEGIICADYKIQTLERALEKALKMTIQERHLMRQYARNRAEESFDYKNYTPVMKDFLTRAINNVNSKKVR